MSQVKVGPVEVDDRGRKYVTALFQTIVDNGMTMQNGKLILYSTGEIEWSAKIVSNRANARWLQSFSLKDNADQFIARSPNEPQKDFSYGTYSPYQQYDWNEGSHGFDGTRWENVAYVELLHRVE